MKPHSEWFSGYARKAVKRLRGPADLPLASPSPSLSFGTALACFFYRMHRATAPLARRTAGGANQVRREARYEHRLLRRRPSSSSVHTAVKALRTSVRERVYNNPSGHTEHLRDKTLVTQRSAHVQMLHDVRDVQEIENRKIR